MNTKYIKHLVLLGMLSLGMSSCDLDVVPPDSMSAESYWKTEKDAWYAMNEIYINGMPDFINGMNDELYTDNAHSHKPWEGPFEAFQQGGVTAGDDYGGYDYTTIRLVNNYLANVDRCDMSDELKARTKAEARFFRAWSYYNMVIKFGGVPLVTDVMDYDAPNVPRDDVQKVQNFVLSELDEVAGQLPESYAGGSIMNETGRVSRYAALALRARAALAFSNYAEAEKSANAVIASGKFKLYQVGELTEAQEREAEEMSQYVDFDRLGIDRDAFVRGIFSYEGVWQNDNGNVSDPEVILAREHMNDANDVDWARYQYARPSQLVRGYSSYEPLPDLVEAYWNADGKTVPTPVGVDQNKQNYENLYSKVEGLDQKGYIAKVPELDLKDDAFMQQFRNRDSRLYASILFPFKGWHETDFGTFYYRWNPAWAGKDGNESWTGFSFRKLVSLRPFDTGWGENYSYDDFPVLRYAETLLTAAEAHIVNTGYDDKARALLNQLRTRCGMPDVPASFGSKDEALEFVRNERRIELAGEGNRFADMRRYGNEYCAKVMTGTSYAISKYVVVDKKWESKNMLFPIPTSATDLNPLLEQNPGY